MSLGQLFTILAFVTGAAVFWLAARENKPTLNKIGWLALIGAMSGIVGAKLTELIFLGWPVKLPPLLSLDPNVGGRALWGGMVFAWLGVELAKRAFGIRRTTIDAFALAVPAAEVVGRIGCYFNGCCYGEHSDISWAVYQHDAWRHPTQIYSLITAALIFSALFAIRKRIAYEGQLFLIFLILFAGSRFGIEELRWQSGNSILGLSSMQWFCIDMFSIGTVRLIRHHIRNLKQRERSAV